MAMTAAAAVASTRYHRLDMSPTRAVTATRRKRTWKVVITLSCLGVMVFMFYYLFGGPRNDETAEVPTLIGHQNEEPAPNSFQQKTAQDGKMEERRRDGFSSSPRRHLGGKKPHIVMVVADDLGWNDIGYHNSMLNSPTLDDLAARGVNLENYYVQPICSPSRSQLLSGKYQIHTGMQHRVIQMGAPEALPLSAPTIGDQLQANGYLTHALGKWHIGFHTWQHMPTRRGFHSFLGHVGGLDDYYKKIKCGIFPGTGHECGLGVYDNETVVRDNREYSTHFYTRRAEQIIQRHPREEPLFLYIAYQNVHSPMQVPAKYKEAYSNIKDSKRQKFAGMVSCLDEAVKNVTQALIKQGLWDDTVFIFTTDNGGSPGDGGNNWPLRGRKRSHWEGGMRAVGFVHSAFLEEPEKPRHGLMHISDWYPTLLHLAGGQKIPTELDGFNVWNMISMGEPSPRTELLHNIDPMWDRRGRNLFPDTFDVRQQAALRYHEWKLITGNPGQGPHTWFVPPESPGVHRHPTRGTEVGSTKNLWLFNITADPYELVDLSNAYPDVVKTMLDKLAAYEKTAVECVFPKLSPASRPSLHGGAWVPWL